MGVKTLYRADHSIISWEQNRLINLSYIFVCIQKYSCAQLSSEKGKAAWTTIEAGWQSFRHVATCHNDISVFCQGQAQVFAIFSIWGKKNNTLFWELCAASISPLEIFALTEKALSESPNPHSNQGSQSLIYVSSNRTLLCCDEAIQ